MTDEREKPLLSYLEAHSVPFTRFEHSPAASMEECAAVSRAAGADHFKNLFLTNKRQTLFYLVLIAKNKRFRTSVISKLLGTPRLSFAPDELLFEHLALKGGSVSVSGLMNDAQHSVRVAIDKDILKEDSVLIHPGVNTASIRLKTADLTAFIRLLGYDYEVIDVQNGDGADGD